MANPKEVVEEAKPVTTVKEKWFPSSGADAKFTSFRKIKIFEVQGESNTVPLILGDYPHVETIRGYEIILPEVLIKGCLDGSVVESFKHIQLQVPDEKGNIFKYAPNTIVRFPYQDLGPATEAEWNEHIGRK